MTFLAIFFLAMAFPVLGLQALYYLKEGGWLPVTIVDGLRVLNVGWASDPHIMLELHAFLKQIPLAPVLLFLAALSYLVRRRVTKHETTREK